MAASRGIGAGGPTQEGLDTTSRPRIRRLGIDEVAHRDRPVSGQRVSGGHLDGFVQVRIADHVGAGYELLGLRQRPSGSRTSSSHILIVVAASWCSFG